MVSSPETKPNHRPAFLVTIDTEGDDLWGCSSQISAGNASFIPRFQRLCESYGIRPTYLTDYEMVTSEEFQQFGRDIIKRNAGEIGMHLHGWNSPPHVPLTSNDYQYHPYLIEYPPQVMEDKIAFLTSLLEATFDQKMVSHRAGRFGFDETYAVLLAKYGYLVDCSVTPRVSWRKTLGAPNQKGGPDFRRFPEYPYFLDLSDIGQAGGSRLLEVPVTIIKRSPFFIPMATDSFGQIPGVRRVVRKLCGDVSWLKPDGANGDQLLHIVRHGLGHRKPCLEFMLHSSELMPGGSPTFPQEQDIETLYGHLEKLFSLAASTCRPVTLREYYDLITSGTENVLIEA